MKKLIVFESLVICLLLLFIPSYSAIDFQLSNKIGATESNNFYNVSVELNANMGESTHILVPADGDKKYYAIIAGCSEYEDSSHNLPSHGKPFPESTMKYVYDVLLNASNWEEENIVLLLNEEATKKNIFDSLTAMGHIIDGDDVFFFSWNGHGTQVDDIDGDDGDGKDEAICPYDTKNEEGELVNIITDDELDSYFSMIAAEGLFIIFESCMSGGLVDNKTQNNLSFVDVNEDRRVVVMSTPPDKKGFAMYEIGWPMLMLISIAFKDDSCDTDRNGWISAEEAFTYVDKAYIYVENNFILETINKSIILATLIEFFLENIKLRINGIEFKLRLVISTLWAGFCYMVYETHLSKKFMIEFLKILFELKNVENNPNIYDCYFGELNIIKIE